MQKRQLAMILLVAAVPAAFAVPLMRDVWEAAAEPADRETAEAPRPVRGEEQPAALPQGWYTVGVWRSEGWANKSMRTQPFEIRGGQWRVRRRKYADWHHDHVALVTQIYRGQSYHMLKHLDPMADRKDSPEDPQTSRIDYLPYGPGRYSLVIIGINSYWNVRVEEWR